MTKPAEATATQPNPERFFCPHCNAEQPTYGFHYSAPQNMGELLGMMQWFTIYCAECRKILAVNIMAWQPTPKLKEALLAQAQSTPGKPS